MRKRAIDEEIAIHVQRAISEMELYDTQDIRDNREKALQFYEGKMLNIEPEDKQSSRAVSYDVRDAVDFIMPQIMRIFFGGPRTFKYKATHPDYREIIREADDYINEEVLDANDAYEVFYDAFHDALLQQNGILKIYWDDQPVFEVEEQDGLSEIDLAMLEDSDNEIIEQSSEMMEIPDMETGETIEAEIFSVRYKKKIKDGSVKIISIPREEFLITPGARSIEDAKACAHRRRVMRGTLLEEGYKKDDIDKLSPHNYDWDAETQIRDQYEVITNVGEDDWATQEVEVYECFIKFDHDGDDIPSEIRVISGGESQPILDWEVWEDERPFSDLAPERRAHRWAGRSIADHVMDIQEIKSVILRQTLDNMYDNNEPQTVVQQNAVHNKDAIVNKERGAIIWTKTNPRDVVMQIQPQFIAAEALSMLAYMDEMSQKRIGAAKDTQALEMDSLQRQTEFATQAAMSAAYTKVEYIARNMAMGGRKRAAKKIYDLVRRNVAAAAYEFRGEAKEVNPSKWPAHVKCVVNVGLGTGTREKDLSMLTMVLAMQKEIFAELTPTSELWGKMMQSIRETLIKIVEAANLQNAEEYFPPVSDEEVASLKQAAVQASENSEGSIILQAEQIKAKGSVETATVRAQTDMAKAQQDNAAKAVEMEREHDIERQKVAIEQEKVQQAWEKLAIMREELNLDANIKNRHSRLEAAKTYGIEYDDDPVAASSEMISIMAGLRQAIENLNERINGPREIVYDGDKIVGVKMNGELKQAQRNEDGNIVGLN